MTQHAMSKADGAAIHYQLEGMIKGLATFDEMANEADDQDVRALIARLHDAKNAALTVACRRELTRTGVSLVKR